MSLPPPRRPLKSRSVRRQARALPAAASSRRTAAEDDLPSLKKIFRPLLGLLLIGGVLGGCLWVYTSGLKQSARITQGENNGLRAMAAELWNTGMSMRIEDPDADLTLTLAQLRKKLDGTAPAVVVVEDPETGLIGRRITHQILYTAGRRMVITLKVFNDPEHGRVEILEYELGPDFINVMKEYRAHRDAAALRSAAGETSPPPGATAPASGAPAGTPAQENPTVEDKPASGEAKPAAEENPAAEDKTMPEEGKTAPEEETPAAGDKTPPAAPGSALENPPPSAPEEPADESGTPSPAPAPAVENQPAPAKRAAPRGS